MYIASSKPHHSSIIRRMHHQSIFGNIKSSIKFNIFSSVSRIYPSKILSELAQYKFYKLTQDDNDLIQLSQILRYRNRNVKTNSGHFTMGQDTNQYLKKRKLSEAKHDEYACILGSFSLELLSGIHQLYFYELFTIGKFFRGSILTCSIEILWTL